MRRTCLSVDVVGEGGAMAAPVVEKTKINAFMSENS